MMKIYHAFWKRSDNINGVPIKTHLSRLGTWTPLRFWFIQEKKTSKENSDNKVQDNDNCEFVVQPCPTQPSDCYNCIDYSMS